MPRDADPAWEVEKQASTGLSFSGSLGAIKGSIDIEPKGDRLELTVGAEIPAPIAYEIKGKGWIGRVRSTGDYEFEDGEITEYEHGIGDFEMDGEFSIRGGGSALDQKLSFPVGRHFPLMLGPLPAFVGISGTLELRSTAMPEDRGEVGGRVHLSGRAGFALLPDDSVGTFGSMEAKANELRPGPYSSKFTSGLAYELDFPRYDLGFGLVTGFAVDAPSTAAVLFMKVKVEAVQNIHVLVNRKTGERRWCREAVSNTGLAVGGEIRTLGLKFSREHTVWAHEGEPQHDGPNCN